MEFNCEENRQLWRRLYKKALIKWNEDKLSDGVYERIIDEQEARTTATKISLEELLDLDKESWIEYIQNNIKANNAIIVCLCILSL